MDHKKINIFDYDHDILPEFKIDLCNFLDVLRLSL